MFYQKYKPSPPLKDYVQDYYILESEGYSSKPMSIASHANPCFAMVFNYGDRYQLNNCYHQGAYLPNQFLSGQSMNPYQILLAGHIAMAGIIFRGSAFRDIFRIPPPRELIDDRIDLYHLIGTKGEEMVEQLAGATSNLQRIHLLEVFLLEHLASSTQSPTLADRAAAIIMDERGMIRMDELARKIHVSPRQLRRIFKSRVGISPKMFARLKRFSYINLCLTTNNKLSWREFVGKDQFYDQSHFIKDYLEFFGEPPSTQILENRKMTGMLTRT